VSFLHNYYLDKQRIVDNCFLDAQEIRCTIFTDMPLAEDEKRLTWAEIEKGAKKVTRGAENLLKKRPPSGPKTPPLPGVPKRHT
jgi:hypothetical protein